MGDGKSSDKKPEHKHLRPQWSGRDITDQGHAQDLDREAALHEFEGKLPRHEAEDKAYGAYTKTQHAKAAAHHLTGIKLAEAAGDSEQARKHGLMYGLHLKQLGHESIGPVPDEVQQHLRGGAADDGKTSFYKFKVHPGDIYVLPGNNLGKQEKTMANEPKTLSWNEHDDNSGGFLQAEDRDQGVVYRTWEVPHGARPSQHVLVKNDGVKQTTLGYFAKREDALEKAEGVTSMAKSERMAKEGQQLGLTPMGVAQTAKVEKADNSGLRAIRAAQHGTGGGRSEEGSSSASSMSKGSLSASSSSGSMGKADDAGLAAVRAAEEKGGKEASEGMGSSSASYGKKEMSAGGNGGEIREGTSSASRGSHEESSSSASSASSSARPPWMKKDMTDFEAKSERCPKCGQGDCKCGNMGKAELCKKCGKASNLCKCVGMHKTEAQVKLAADEQAAHDARHAEGERVLAKVATESFAPSVGFGTDAKGVAEGTSPDALREQLRNVYVAASFALEKAKAAAGK